MKIGLAKRLISLACIMIILVTIFPKALAEAKPDMISEAEAKKSGLALINRVFNLNEKDAVVALYEHEGAQYAGGDIQPSKDAEPVYYYQVAVMDEKTNVFRYAASVNAKTGVAYKATMNTVFLPDMTAEQRKLADSAGTENSMDNYDFEMVNFYCYQAAREFINNTIQTEVPILGYMERGFGIEKFPEVSAGFYIVMRDGTIYNFDMAWPQMQICNFEILNQIEITMEDA